MRLGIGEEFSKSRTPAEILTVSGYAGGHTIFFGADREKGIKILPPAKIRLCPTDEFLQSPARRLTPKTETIMKASRETIRMKTSEGEVKMAVLGDNPGAEEYLQHINSFLRMLSRKK